MLQRLLSNPVALVGVFRALALAIVPYGFTWATPAAVDGWLNFLAVLLPFISLVFTGASATWHSAEVSRALHTPAPGDDPAA